MAANKSHDLSPASIFFKFSGFEFHSRDGRGHSKSIHSNKRKSVCFPKEQNVHEQGNVTKSVKIAC